MVKRTPAEIVQKFFAVRGRASLVLPDGWYGRPYDSLFALVSAVNTSEGLNVEIEGNRQLFFKGSPLMLESKWGKSEPLKIGSFDELIWLPHDGISEKRVYNSGEVLFVP